MTGQYNICVFLLVLAIVLSVTASKPLVIAHRGSSGEYPDLTMEAFRLAADQKADLIELDICLTKDGHLVVIHEPALSLSTNIENITKFQSRRRFENITTTAKSTTKKAQLVHDWILTDFTFSEIQGIRKRQRESFRNQKFNGMYSIPSFIEVLDFIKKRNDVGLLIELKTPSYFNHRINSTVSMEELVISDLKQFGFDTPLREGPRIILQSFEEDSVSRMLRITKLPVVLLQSYGYPDANGLKQWKDQGLYGIGLRKVTLLGIQKEDDFKGDKSDLIIPFESQIVKRSHAAGLKVFVWTFRNEDRFLAWNFGNDPIREIETFNQLEVDGIITDFPATSKFVLTCSADRVISSLSINLILVFLLILLRTYMHEN